MLLDLGVMPVVSVAFRCPPPPRNLLTLMPVSFSKSEGAPRGAEDDVPVNSLAGDSDDEDAAPNASDIDDEDTSVHTTGSHGRE